MEQTEGQKRNEGRGGNKHSTRQARTDISSCHLARGMTRMPAGPMEGDFNLHSSIHPASPLQLPPSPRTLGKERQADCDVSGGCRARGSQRPEQDLVWRPERGHWECTLKPKTAPEPGAGPRKDSGRSQQLQSRWLWLGRI